jgi:hypothetical protein
MPDAATVKLLVDAYGWPLFMAAVILGAGYLLLKRGDRHGKALDAVTDVNRSIAFNLQQIADSVRSHDEKEAMRHAEALRAIERGGGR